MLFLTNLCSNGVEITTVRRSKRSAYAAETQHSIYTTEMKTVVCLCEYSTIYITINMVCMQLASLRS